MSAQKIVLEGALKKEGGIFWKQKHFVLYANKSICQFDKKGDAKPTDTFDLSPSDTKVTDISADKKKPNTICVQNSKTKWIMQAENESVMDQWLDCLEEILQKSSSSSAVLTPSKASSATPVKLQPATTTANSKSVPSKPVTKKVDDDDSDDSIDEKVASKVGAKNFYAKNSDSDDDSDEDDHPIPSKSLPPMTAKEQATILKAAQQTVQESQKAAKKYESDDDDDDNSEYEAKLQRTDSEASDSEDDKPYLARSDSDSDSDDNKNSKKPVAPKKNSSNPLLSGLEKDLSQMEMGKFSDDVVKHLEILVSDSELKATIAFIDDEDLFQNVYQALEQAHLKKQQKSLELLLRLMNQTLESAPQDESKRTLLRLIRAVPTLVNIVKEHFSTSQVVLLEGSGLMKNLLSKRSEYVPSILAVLKEMIPQLQKHSSEDEHSQLQLLQMYSSIAMIAQDSDFTGGVNKSQMMEPICGTAIQLWKNNVEDTQVIIPAVTSFVAACNNDTALMEVIGMKVREEEVIELVISKAMKKYLRDMKNTQIIVKLFQRLSNSEQAFAALGDVFCNDKCNRDLECMIHASTLLHYMINEKNSKQVIQADIISAVTPILKAYMQQGWIVKYLNRYLKTVLLNEDQLLKFVQQQGLEMIMDCLGMYAENAEMLELVMETLQSVVETKTGVKQMAQTELDICLPSLLNALDTNLDKPFIQQKLLSVLSVMLNEIQFKDLSKEHRDALIRYTLTQVKLNKDKNPFIILSSISMCVTLATKLGPFNLSEEEAKAIAMALDVHVLDSQAVEKRFAEYNKDVKIQLAKGLILFSGLFAIVPKNKELFQKYGVITKLVAVLKMYSNNAEVQKSAEKAKQTLSI